MIRKKKLAIAALALVVSTAAHAQFESGKQYIGASLTGLNLIIMVLRISISVFRLRPDTL